MLHRLLFIVLVATVPVETFAREEPCKSYAFWFLDYVLEGYSTELQVDPTEFAAHREPISWRALSVIHRCPSSALQYLSRDLAASIRWIDDLPTVIEAGAGQRTSRAPLIIGVARQIKAPPASTINADLRNRLAQALRVQKGEPADSAVPVTRHMWCEVLLEDLGREWVEPDGFLKADASNTAVILPYCPLETVSFLRDNPRVMDLWTANLNPAQFEGEVNDTQTCHLAADILSATKRLRKSRGMRAPADKITRAASDVLKDCRF